MPPLCSTQPGMCMHSPDCPDQHCPGHPMSMQLHRMDPIEMARRLAEVAELERGYAARRGWGL